MGSSETKKLPLTVTVIALNEERDLPRCLQSVGFADEVIVVDSGSTDKTVEIAQRFGARVEREPWRGYGPQKNHAMSLARNNWVLNLDADEALTPELQSEIEAVVLGKTVSQSSGYAIARKTYYMGRWIRFGGWYPNYVTRLARRSSAKWSEPQVHEELQVDGPIARLKNPMLHYTFSDIADQVRTNIRYALQGSEVLASRGVKGSVLLMLFKPIGKFLESYVLKQGFRDGLAGLVIAVNAAHSMFMKYAFLLERERRSGS